VAREVGGGAERRIVGSRLNVSGQDLGRACESAPAHSSEGECGAIPPLHGLCVERRDVRRQVFVVCDLPEVVQRRSCGGHEVDSARALEERFRVGSFGGMERAIGVDEPLTRLHRQRPGATRANEEDLVCGVENEWRSLDGVEFERALSEGGRARIPERSDQRRWNSVMDDENALALVAKNRRGTRLSVGLPAGIRRDLDRFLDDVSLDA